jgi:hypothetical protein
VPNPKSPDAESPEAFLASQPLGLAVLARLRAALGDVPGVSVQASKSQVVFRRRRGFAWLWLPGQYLRKPAADVVLSIGLGRHAASARWKEVAHPAPTHWMHHLEIGAPDDIDAEVLGWLQEAAERAA